MVSKGFSRHQGLTHRRDLSRVRGSISPQGPTNQPSLGLQGGFSPPQGLVRLPASRDLLGRRLLQDLPPLPNLILHQTVSRRWEKKSHQQTLSLKASLRPPKRRWMIRHPPRILLPKESCQMTSSIQEMDFLFKVTPFPRPLSRQMRRRNLKTRARKWLTNPNPNPHQRRPKCLCPRSLLHHRNSLLPTATKTPSTKRSRL